MKFWWCVQILKQFLAYKKSTVCVLLCWRPPRDIDDVVNTILGNGGECIISNLGGVEDKLSLLPALLIVGYS